VAWLLRYQTGTIFLALAGLAILGGSGSAGGQALADTETVRKALEDIAAGRGDPAPLVVTYDDLHGLWGGLRLTIQGTGHVEQTAKREQVGEPHTVPRADLVKLAALLVHHAAWEQRVPDRVAAPDESRTVLTITYGQAAVQIWEWHNDLQTNNRISAIGDFMKHIAWQRPEKQEATLPAEFHAVTSRGITVHFGGEKPPGDTPLEFGVSALWFTFVDDQTPYVFKPTGELYFSDWRFDLFSPDGAYILLLQSHHGPYHVVATSKLRDYLTGRAGDLCASKRRAWRHRRQAFHAAVRAACAYRSSRYRCL
jgi:hypothetical protein